MQPQTSPAEVRRDLSFAIAAAQSAGARALALRATGRWQGDMLADVGDQAADGFLQGLVQGRYPEDGILSEETADTTDRLKRERVWIIDPLDGTREFSELRDDWAVHVALTVGGRCLLGAVALPAQGELVWGVCGANELEAGNTGGSRLARGDSKQPETPRIAVSRSHTPSWTPAFANYFGSVLVPSGSVGNKVAMLLLGQADIYVHKKGLKEWDTCAPECVARALGWTVCKLHGEDHRYNQADPKNHELVVCRPAWKTRVLEALESAGALKG
jgi:3'(2'), 5'-bisphosphate nucleotidase